MNHRSLAFRLGAWYTLLLGSVFVLVGTGVFFGLQHYLRSNVRYKLLGRRSAQVEQILLQAPAEAADETIAREINTHRPGINNRFVRVTRLPATVIYRSGLPANRSFICRL